ncbi:hypothetical protein FACS1894218_3420 [Bacilli bacterium]|nr:hypothetical protein FACS1894218_3420 [Bacilli bacterium]
MGGKHEYPPISFLTDTSVDHYFDSKSQSEKYQTVISKFMKKLGVEFTYEKTIVMPQFTEIHFEVSTKAMIDEVLSKQNDLLSELKIVQFNISFKGNIIRFEIPNKTPSKISLRSIFNTIQNIQPNESIVGLSEENNPLIIDTQEKPNTLIIGRRGSGGAMLLSSMIASLAYINNPTTMSFIVLAPIADKSLKYLDGLPQMLYPVISELDESVIKLQNLYKEIGERDTKLKEAGATNLKEYNKFQANLTNRYKEILLVISSFDKIAKISLQNMELISNILKDGPKCGVKTILLSLNANNESMDPVIYDHMNVKCILRLENEQESLKVFDSYRGIQLFGNGDGFFVDDKAKTKVRFQTCYLNVNELVEIIKVVKTFYEVKEEQRATSV